MMFARLLVVSALVASSAAPVDQELDDFDGVVRRMESHFQKRRLWIPFLGAINFVSNVARPLGASDFKLAVIEDIGRRGAAPVIPFRPHWKPIVRVRERDGESVDILAREDGHRSVKLLMMVVDDDDAVVMQMRMEPTRFLEFVGEKARGHHAN